MANHCNDLTVVATDLFLKAHTSLKDLLDAGWYVDHSMGGGFWFRNRGTQQRQSLPHWINELVFDAERQGREVAQHQIRFALGIKDDKPKRKAKVADANDEAK